MDKKYIKKCRVCNSLRLGEAFGIDSKYYFVFCKNCTALQRKDNIPYEIQFNFEGRTLEVPYYPAFLKAHDSTPLLNGVIFFSLLSLDFILQIAGYEIVEIEQIGFNLQVHFEPLSKLKRLRLKEERLKLDNQYTYALWAMQLKK